MLNNLYIMQRTLFHCRYVLKRIIFSMKNKGKLFFLILLPFLLLLTFLLSSSWNITLLPSLFPSFFISYSSLSPSLLNSIFPLIFPPPFFCFLIIFPFPPFLPTPFLPLYHLPYCPLFFSPFLSSLFLAEIRYPSLIKQT